MFPEPEALYLQIMLRPLSSLTPHSKVVQEFMEVLSSQTLVII